MVSFRRLARMRGTGCALAARLAAIIVVVLIAGALPVGASVRADQTASREQVSDAAHAHFVAPNSTSPAVAPIRNAVNRAGTSSPRRSPENALLRVLAIVLAALSLVAWRRGYVAGRRERIRPSSEHSGSVYFVRGPPPCPSRYPAAVAVGDRLMHTMREDWKYAIRHRADRRAHWGARISR
jgi:hypothetical protein